MEGIRLTEELLNELETKLRRYTEAPAWSSGSYYRPKPPVALVRDQLAYFMGLSPADTFALGSLIVAVWTYIFPRDRNPRCPFSTYFNRETCGRRLVDITYVPEKQELHMTCELGHTTVQRTARVYR
jgi:hypothetical protein